MGTSEVISTGKIDSLLVLSYQTARDLERYYLQIGDSVTADQMGEQAGRLVSQHKKLTGIDIIHMDDPHNNTSLAPMLTGLVNLPIDHDSETAPISDKSSPVSG